MRFANLIRGFQEKASRLASQDKKSSDETEVNEPEAAQPSKDSEFGANCFIADIKNAAHEAQNDTGFIYEPTSGLYYDSRTGYYYNAVCLAQFLVSYNAEAYSEIYSVFVFNFRRSMDCITMETMAAIIHTIKPKTSLSFIRKCMRLTKHHRQLTMKR